MFAHVYHALVHSEDNTGLKFYCIKHNSHFLFLLLTLVKMYLELEVVNELSAWKCSLSHLCIIKIVKQEYNQLVNLIIKTIIQTLKQ